MVTCTVSALSTPTPGKKITYTTTCPCAGIPAGGTTIASTTLCASCTLTLDVTGGATGTGIFYQWERSANGTTWSSIPGATASTYVCAPTQPYAFRRKTTCTVSSLSTYSSPITVATPVDIIQDSVRQTPDTSCSGQLFFVKTNSPSPLLAIKTYFGDGQTATTPVTPLSTTSYANTGHTYINSGTYTVKQVLCIDTTSLDSITFSYEHRDCHILPIKFYFDDNSNCIKDGSEQFSYGPNRVKVDSNGITIDTLSLTSGIYYKTNGIAGTIYRFSLLPGGATASCPVGGVWADTMPAGVGVCPTRYIATQCGTPSYYDVAQYTTLLCGSHMARATILMTNTGCSSVSPTMTLNLNKYRSNVYSTALTPAGALAGPSTKSGPMTYTWPVTVTTASSISRLLTAYLNTTGPTLIIGDTVRSDEIIAPVAGDYAPGNNSSVRVDTVKGSFDPNMIEVTPAGCFDADTVFQFTVNFENMGNDTAYNVHVMDTLSPNLDWRSLEVLASSHVMNIYPYEAGGYRIVKFDFPDIDLLDSAQHGLNNGVFVYRVRSKPGIAVGSSILSRVGIYFDDNDVVMTNGVENTKGCPTLGTVMTKSAHAIHLYPNPASSDLMIEAPTGAFTSLTVNNVMGQQMLQHDIDAGRFHMDISALPAGVYTVVFHGVQGNEMRKFVKW